MMDVVSEPVEAEVQPLHISRALESVAPHLSLPISRQRSIRQPASHTLATSINMRAFSLAPLVAAAGLVGMANAYPECK
jgi:hypothetical protein